MAPRFLVPDLDTSGEVLVLSPEEAHHAIRVMRLTAGTLVELFNGAGRECAATIDSISREAVTCRRGPVTASASEPSVRVTLVQSALAGGALDDVVRDATMLGVHRIEIVCPARAQISPPALERRNLMARWTRVAIASAKQCGRAVVPSLHVWRGLEDALAAERAGDRVLLAEPSVTATATWSPREHMDARREAHVLVGPEGGWMRVELDLAGSLGWRPWRLGPRTLRADAAGRAALAVLLYEWEGPPTRES
jgi:16S rRNA (uracil1498-N3)-methyltransferase